MAGTVVAAMKAREEKLQLYALLILAYDAARKGWQPDWDLSTKKLALELKRLAGELWGGQKEC